MIMMMMMMTTKKATSLKTEYLVVLVLVVLGCILNLRQCVVLPAPQASSNPPNSYSTAESTAKTSDQQRSMDPLTLTWGDLPGYTGWPRPTRSTAAWYQVDEEQSFHKARTDNTVAIPFHCRHPDCRHLDALFDVRAYGPAILPGTIENYHNGSYVLSILFHDPGVYVVEIVLAFSHAPPLESFPIKDDPMYEGYLLPGTPLQIEVQASGTGDKPSPDISRSCDAQDLYESHEDSIWAKARWKVATRTQGFGGVPVVQNSTSFLDYKYGFVSLGFTTDYVYHNCTLTPLDSLRARASNLPSPLNHVVVFIGDSNMRNQHKLFLQHFGRIFPSVYLKTNDGLLTRMSELRHNLKQMQQQYPVNETRFYILFNAGLHEIAVFCSQQRVRSRGRVISTPDDEFSCTEQYRASLTEFLQLVQSVPSPLRVFQSTPAGWLRWGNYGFVWEPNRTQQYPLDSHACADMNKIAYEIMQTNHIPVMDSYWLTVPRADHREIDAVNARGKKMVHAGVEIYDVLLRKWLSLVLEHASKDEDW